MSSGAGPTLAYVRLGLDRALPLPAGRNVIAAGPSGSAGHRVTGVERTAGGADVLDLEEPAPEGATKGAPRKRRRDRDPAGTRYVVTLVRASEPLGPKEAAAALDGWRRESSEAQRWVGAALGAVNRAIRAHRLVQRDPYAVEVTLDDVVWAAVGCASAEVLANGGAGDQIAALPKRRGRLNSTQRARPGETVGLALTGVLPMLEGEELLAVAVREANHDRMRSASAALAAARDVLADELSGSAASAVAALGAPRLADADAVFAATEELQDVVDLWRSGLDPHEAPGVVRAAEAEARAEARVPGAGRPGDLPGR